MQGTRRASSARIRQSAADCLAYFSKYTISVPEDARVEPDIRGLQSFVAAARRRHLGFRQVQLAGSDTHDFREPAVVVKADGCVAMLLRLSAESATLVDPESGSLRVLPRREVVGAATCTEVAVFIGSRLPSLSGLRFATLGRFVARHKLAFLALIVLTFLVNLCGLAVPAAFLLIIDTVIAGGRIGWLDGIVLAFVGVALVEFVGSILRNRLHRNTATKIGGSLYRRFVSHFLSLPLEASQRRAMQAYFNVNELSRISTITADTVVLVAVDAFFVALFLAVAFYFSTTLGIVMAVSLPFLFVGHYLFVPVFQKRLVESLTARRQWNEGLIDNFTGIETIKTMSAENHAERLFMVELGRLEASKEIVSKLESQFSAYRTLVGRLSLAVLLWAGVHAITAGTLTLGQFMAVYLLNMRLARPVESLSRVVFDYQHLRSLLENVDQTVRLAPEVRSDDERPDWPTLRGSITFADVGFRYARSSRDVLQNISFEIGAGQVVGLIGPSGSGKTTITKLLQGLYAPHAGKVLIDGVDVSAIHPKWLRENFGTVEQECRLFRGTIAENIALGSLVEDSAAVVEAAQLAGAHDFIVRLPQGYDTVVDRRDSLSGGQRQCLALARAVFRNPRVLVLDEATSAMDYETEGRVQGNLEHFMRGRTVVIVAHRLSALRQVDSIVTVEGGQISQIGAPEELLMQPDSYLSRMVEQLSSLQRFERSAAMPAARIS